MAIFRGAGGPGDATTDAANEASVASTKAAEAEASATAAASSATSASNSATTAINSKDAAATSESNAATSALAASTSEDNASTSASAADTSATAAQTAQTAAEAAKTAAETAETGAEVAKTAAESAQTAAELAQTGAETAETNAETAQTAAESALASTLSTLDEFDDIYLGAKASPPNTDNDGNTLQTGAIYWDTGDNQLYIWDGANWDAAAFNVTGAVTSFNTRTGAVTLQNDDVTTAVGQSLQVGDSPTFVGVTATGNIAVTGTVDGRDVATDGTKLDGIEANADVTDTTNVTAAGAVMDSELTSEASVKALDQGVATTDSPSFAGLTVDTDTLYVDSTNNRVGIGTSSPGYTLDVATASGDVEIRLRTAGTGSGDHSIFRNSIAGTTGSNYIFFGDNVDSDAGFIRYNHSNNDMSFQTNASEAMRIDGSGNVGIGTSSPAEPLDVIGTIRSNTSSTGDFNFYATSTGGGAYRIYPDDATTANPTWLYQSNSSEDQAWVIGGVERMRLNSSGNVGIGTNSPTVKLHVSSTGTPIFRIQDADGSDYYAQISQATGNTIFDTRFGASNGAFIFRGLGGGTADEYMRINSSGNVGIGTTAQANRLEVEGAVVAQGAIDSYTNDGLYLSNQGSSIFQIGAWRSGANASILTFATDSGSDAAPVERMRINNSGNVGIGTNSPSGMLHLSGALPRIYLTDTDTATVSTFSGENGWLTLSAATSRITFNIAGSEKMRIVGDNVGIGTTSPSQKLTVNGTDARIYLTGANTDINMDNSASGQLSLDGNAYAFGIALNSSGANLYTNSVSRDLIFGVNETEVMRVTNDSVGIGTTSPLTKLVTVGTTMANSQAFVGSVADTSYSGGIINLSNSSRSIGITSDPTNAGASSILNFSVDGSERMRIDSSGNVGIGTNTPVSLLHVKSTIPVVTADSLGFASAGDGTGFGIYRSGAGRIAGYTWTITNKIRSGGSSGSDYQTDDLIFSRRATTTDSTLTEAMRITSAGYVGIGTTSPASLLHLSSGSPRITLTDTGTGADHRINADSGAGNLAFDVDYNSDTTSPAVIFNIKGTEHMRIASTGDVFWGTTSTPDVKDDSCVTFEPDVGRVHINANSTAVPLELNQSAPDTLTRTILRFHRNEAIVGSVTASTTGVNYNESSDYRLKENVTLITDAVDRLKQLKPSRFNFIVEPDRTVDGFIAHEVQAVVPQAVMGDKDEVDADGNPVMQGIDQSKLVPLLTAALQEAITKIEALEARVTALESN